MTATKLSDGVQIFAASMGKIFRVTHVCKTASEANKAMEQDGKTTLIAIDNNGLHYLANQYGSKCPSALLTP
jgi:hypothetical protein